MTEQHADTFEFFLSPGGSDETGEGTAANPLRTLDKVLETIAAFHGGEQPAVKALAGYDQIEIVSIPAPGAEFHLRNGQRFQHFIDPLQTGQEADGSELFPWPDLETAIRCLGLRYAAAPPCPGSRIRLSVREVFTATSVERRKKRKELVAKSVFLLMTIALVLPLLAIFAYLVVKAWPVLSPAFVWENPTNGMRAGGIWAPLVGTFYLVFMSLLAAAPIGILAGVYLNEYARDNWLTRIINLAVVNLAGVPSIVHALFGVGAFVAFAGMGRSVLAASCTLAIMTLPVIITSTKEALASVPMSFREACLNMGASRWQTIRTIVLPNSISGILTGVILQVSRAAGETAPILFTGAAAYVRVPSHGLASFFPYALDQQCMALSYHLYVLMTEVNRVSDSMKYGTAVVLIGLVLVVNSFSISLRVYLRARKKW
jgi:phosphate transport system permease protein